MTEIQTYALHSGAMVGCSSGGKWVKRADHEAALAAQTAEIAQLKERNAALEQEQGQSAFDLDDWRIRFRHIHRRVDELTLAGAQKSEQIKSYEKQVQALEEQLAALSAPVSDDEWGTYDFWPDGSESSVIARQDFNSIIAQRKKG